jgi:GT2 family glycosyltransferase
VDQLRASIVVLCYNGLEETTRPCLESIIKNTPADSYELIVVDNASSDGTAEYLKSFATQHANVRLQLNETNRGYAGGNNDGIKLAQGQYIVLLNNDTLVPKGWLERLLKIFSEQREVGLVGPVTNSAGNEQRIAIEGMNERNFEEIANAYIERQQGEWFTTEKLGFFCVAMRRSLLEKIGYLDEKFGIGMFEDDDYCIRAKKAGFALAVVEDCFVYHKGSVSFKKLATSNYIEIFNRNRKYFYEKHGVLWIYADIAVSIWAKLQGDVKELVKLGGNAATERIAGRLDDMSNALYQLREVEQKQTEIGGKSFLETQLAEKQKVLMEISDWATSLKKDNERLVDEAMTVKRDIEEMSRSRCYRIFRFLQRRGI